MGPVFFISHGNGGACETAEIFSNSKIINSGVLITFCDGWMKLKGVEARTKLSSVTSVSLMILASLFGVVTDQCSMILAEGNHTISEVSSIINYITDLLIEYNDTLCYYSGADGYPANGTNYTRDIMSKNFDCLATISCLLSNISSYQELINSAYHNLFMAREEFMEMNNPIEDLNQTSVILDNDYNEIAQYITGHYDLENATEEDIINITADLFNDSNFTPLFNNTMSSLFNYTLKNTNITYHLVTATGNLTDSTRNLITELFVREEAVPEKLIMTENTTNLNNSKIDQTAATNLSSESNNESSKSTDGITVPKLVTHNYPLPAPNGEIAFHKAQDMGMDQIRMDYDWDDHYLYDSSYSWNLYNDPNNPTDNRWYDISKPNLKWCESHGFSTLAVVKCQPCPGASYNRLRDSYEDYWLDYCEHLSSNPPPIKWVDWSPDMKKSLATLWACWAFENNILFTGTPQHYISSLLSQFHTGINSGEFEISGYNIENEPNVVRPGRDNYVSIDIPTGTKSGIGVALCWVLKNNGEYSLKFKVGRLKWATFTTYSTCDQVNSEARYLKNWLSYHNEMKQVSIVVNLHSWGHDWKKQCWKELAKSNTINVIGIDTYRTHLELWIDLKHDMVDMYNLHIDVNKPWWIVETEGADSPSDSSKNPSVEKIRQTVNYANDQGVHLIGFYRLWGNSNGDHDSAYNIYTNPGNNPTPRIDDDGRYYWEGLRDL